MAAYTVEFSEAFPNKQILSSGWNRNNEVGIKRLRRYDHCNCDDKSAPKIGILELDEEVINRSTDLEGKITAIGNLTTELNSRVNAYDTDRFKPRIEGYHYSRAPPALIGTYITFKERILILSLKIVLQNFSA